MLEGLDGGPPEASCPARSSLDPWLTFYDFEAKYLDRQHRGDPGAASAEEIEDIRGQAVGVFETLACEGLARVDFFYTPAGRVLVNEINTMPGFTPTSCSRRCGRPPGCRTRS